MDYAVVIVKLSEEDGGGYLARVPDLYGCMSDGETPEEAARNIQAAIADWIEVSKSLGRKIPEPGVSLNYAKERESHLLGTIKILSEQMDGIDDRLDEISREFEHLKELFENQEAWSRFDAIAHQDLKTQRLSPQIC